MSFNKRRVKIVCTLGPSSKTVEQIQALIEEGMDVARLNFSHGTHEFHQGMIANIREASKRAKKTVGIMQDLQGPKIRLGRLPTGGIDIKVGEKVLLHPEGTPPKLPSAGCTVIPISAEIAMAVAQDLYGNGPSRGVGARILFDDGKFATRVLQVQAPDILVEVEVGGHLSDHKGMNLPGTPLSIPCVTAKDLDDLKFGLEQGVDAVALSFVRSAQDITTVREQIKKMMRTMNTTAPILVAKIEREEAIEAQDSIIEVSDCLLVARGDMATEIGAERVPTVQKQLIRGCNELGVPIITATQMLESMISSPTPTRAEASDVANAVYDGTDAVMLSGETASGQYPREAVRVMARIILEAERSPHLRHRGSEPIPGSVVDAIEASAAKMARQTGAVAIACLTHSGMAARTLAKFRPETPIVAILDNEAMLRRLSFVWGVHGALIPKLVGTDDLFAMVEKTLQSLGWAQAEDLVVVTAGVPTLRRGTTNMVKIHRIGVIDSRDKSI